MKLKTSNFAVETKNCASAGLSSTKSSVPLRTCSTTWVTLGLIAPSMTACSTVNQPSTNSASAYDQPATVLRSWKTTNKGTNAVTVQKASSSPSSAKSHRYCNPSSVEVRTCNARRRRYLATERSEAAQPAAEHEDGERKKRERPRELEREALQRVCAIVAR